MTYDDITIGYENVVGSKSGIPAIMLTDPPYEGVVFTYGALKLKDEDSNGILHVEFEHTIFKDNDKDVYSQDFLDYIGELLSQLVEVGIDNNTLVVKEKGVPSYNEH